MTTVKEEMIWDKKDYPEQDYELVLEELENEDYGTYGALELQWNMDYSFDEPKPSEHDPIMITVCEFDLPSRIQEEEALVALTAEQTQALRDKLAQMLKELGVE